MPGNIERLRESEVGLEAKGKSNPLTKGLQEAEKEAGAQHRARRERVLVGLIDPRPLTRHSVSAMLERCMGEASVLAVASPEELLADNSTPWGHVRLIIFNLGNADIHDQEFRRHLTVLNASLDDIPIIVLADQSSTEDVAEALRCGVRGYIPTTLHPSIAIEVLRLVHAGGTFVPASAFARTVAHEPETVATTPAPAMQKEQSGLGDFTPRQDDVLKLLLQGKSNKAIARELNMQECTVKVHVRQIMKKLNATNRTEAVINASKLKDESRH